MIHLPCSIHNSFITGVQPCLVIQYIVTKSEFEKMRREAFYPLPFLGPRIKRGERRHKRMNISGFSEGDNDDAAKDQRVRITLEDGTTSENYVTRERCTTTGSHTKH